MRFNRADLIKRIQEEIVRREDRAVRLNREAAEKHAEKRTQYLDRTTDAWRELADTIRRRIRTKTPVVGSDIPVALRNGYSGGGHIETWRDTEPTSHAPDVEPLTTLLHLLQSCTEDEISTNALQRLGFRTADLFRTR